MDQLCTTEDVEQALEGLVPGVTSNLKISSMRPFRQGRQAVTVSGGKSLIEKLIQQRQIRIGCNNCFIERKYVIVKCSKCWASGHLERECKSTKDLRENCFKCGEKGHLVKDCQNSEKCPVCSEDGHRSGTGKCRDFKR
ncbi:hypothetical protein ABEB36_009312 [Hypothenemus hampei]|uniref:CCHC-type domain-containing protein n=1 Tax=Hypothenemus hampei TaxID=57062 RepID=A0ABD1EGK8_HYPHA